MNGGGAGRSYLTNEEASRIRNGANERLSIEARVRRAQRRDRVYLIALARIQDYGWTLREQFRIERTIASIRAEERAYGWASADEFRREFPHLPTERSAA